MELKLPLIAAIDVGSNYIQMIIAELNPEGQVKILEDVIQPTSIGRDTFTMGRIDRKTIQETCEILKGFSQLLKDYRVKDYHAVGTSGIREAENREYVLELIRLKTKIEVEIINSAQERFFMYRALRSRLPGPLLAEQTTLIVNLASGGVETSIYEKGALIFTEYLKIGSLRLRETLADLEAKSINFPAVMEEFIDSKTSLLKRFLQDIKFTNFIMIGNEVRTVANLCGEDQRIEVEDFTKLYEKLLIMTDDQITRTCGLVKNQADTFLPTVITLHCFLKLTHARQIYVPDISLKNGLIHDLADGLIESPQSKDSLNDMISSVWYIANRFGADRRHAEQVEKLALSLFDQTGKIHGLGQQERLYLQVAAILHAVGYFISFTDHQEHAYRIIRHHNIMGLSARDLILIANIVRYNTQESPSHQDENYEGLMDRDKIVVSKLAALLKLAEALDVSHKNKVEKVEVHRKGEQLIFTMYSWQDPFLEEWTFQNCSSLFEEVTGMQVIVKRKGLSL
ncbi:HD domain-containing protein [Desulfitobacterium hafniense]|uniref:Ppx/GppA phosphatase family protein n=1 Tax=Desulfitobacterium hafniense TaxID=49338 RepID=UPI000366B4CE|nr:HD domain-containing protein [Desulfitobacterium hafniense]